MRKASIALIAAGAAVGFLSEAQAASDAALIRSAMSAASRSISKDAATVVVITEKGEVRVLRKGTNKFTCLPDDPMTPGNDPMCADPGGMAWLQALLSRQPPPANASGIAYMLQGATDASNSDPFAMTPEKGQPWVKTGPHLMVFGMGAALDNYPHDAKPDTSAPYVMFPGTPYAHLMVPVK